MNVNGVLVNDGGGDKNNLVNRDDEFDDDDDDDAKQREDQSVTNIGEAQVIRVIVKHLERCAMPMSEMAVISPYRAQLRLLRLAFAGQGENVEVDTVDKFQGRDKECIIISMVRSNANRNIGSLLLDWRRINVAFTRAKCKLIIVGNADTLSASPVCLKFLTIIRRKSWEAPLPSNAGDFIQRFLSSSASNASQYVSQ